MTFEALHEKAIWKNYQIDLRWTKETHDRLVTVNECLRVTKNNFF